MASIIGEKVLKSTGKSYAGVIRPGTKVPTKATLGNPKAKAIYERVGRGEIDFREAEKLIGKDTDIKYPFYPKNPEHFNLAGSDFTAGNVAVLRLLDLYGELRNNDDRKQLYSFPIVFQDGGTADAAVPSRFEVHGAPIKYRSMDDPEGGARKCVYLKPVEASAVLDQRARRIKQVAPREFTVRGNCEPAKCPEFSCGVCKFRGTIEFYVPGLQGLGLLRMSTSSTYAAIEIWQQLDQLYKTYGRLPNFTPNGDPVFSLTKKKRKAKFFDEDGKEATGEQWVPVLNAQLDFASMMLIEERNIIKLAAPATVAQPSLDQAPAAWVAPLVTEKAKATAGTHSQVDANCKEPEKLTLVEQAFGFASAHGVTNDQFASWAKAKFGPDWDDDVIVAEAQCDFTKLSEKIKPDCLVAILALTSMLYGNKIPVPDVGIPFLLKEFGTGLLQDKVLLAKARQRVVEMMESGPEVALAFMKQAVVKAA